MQSDFVAKLQPKLAEDAFLAPGTGTMIREARERLKIPQKVLALELEIGQPYLSDLEADHRQWRMDLFERAKAALIKLANEQ